MSPRRLCSALSIVAFASIVTACNGTRRSAPPTDEEESSAPYQAEIDEGLGAAIAIAVDSSGSMSDAAPGDDRPKAAIAGEAPEAMLDATEAFVTVLAEASTLEREPESR